MIDISKLKQRSDKTAQIGVRVSPAIKRWLEEHCLKNGVSASSLVAALINMYKAEIDLKNS